MKPYTWRAAILRSGLPATTRHVLLTLSCYINDVGQSAYPSTKTLASDTGLSERAVITHLHQAEKAGWLKIAKHGFGGQRWAHNEYFPTAPEMDYIEAEPEKGTEPDASPSQKALNATTKGTERRSKGTEPDDIKALNDVQSNRPIELSKEQTKEQKGSTFVLPDWIPADSWNAYIDMRNKKKKPLTDYARDLVIKTLKQLHEVGYDVAVALDNSTLNCWTDVYAPKSPHKPQIGRESERDRSRRETIENLTGKRSYECPREIIDIN